jgi:hypothetical protein
MAFRSSVALAGAVGVAAVLAVHAAPADPLDPKAAVPAPAHRSAFDGYRRHDDAKPVPWRQANDTVGRIGGWRAYAREAAASAPATAASAPAPAGGHRH